MEFSRQEYWSGLVSFSKGPDPGIEPRSLALQADSLPAELRGKPNPLVMGFKIEGFIPITGLVVMILYVTNESNLGGWPGGCDVDSIPGKAILLNTVSTYCCCADRW